MDDSGLTTTDYIFDEHQQDQELVRLRMIEELFDPAATESDIDLYVRNTNDDQFWTVYYSTVSVTATRRPC